jgi:5-methylcytosine-specific restriction endonuclease McrA
MTKLRSEGIITTPRLITTTIKHLLKEKQNIKNQRNGNYRGKYLPKTKTVLGDKYQTNPEENGKCPICLAEPIKFSKHHITPRAKGGTDNFANIVRVCKGCHDKLEEYADKDIYYSPQLATQIRLTQGD